MHVHTLLYVALCCSKFIQDDIREDMFDDRWYINIGPDPQFPLAPRSRPATHDSGGFFFGPEDLQILDCPNARLNGTCLNSCATLLQEFYSSPYSNCCAILSTHDLVRVRYNASDNDFWRNLKRTKYWVKDIWILPIHRTAAEHWVLAVIYPRSSKIHLFDSLADRKGWKRDVEVSRYSVHSICY
jgi:Ulp1 protease family, C-terminal catalytic domain